MRAFVVAIEIAGQSWAHPCPWLYPLYNSAAEAIEGQFAAAARCRLPERQDANDCCAVQNRQDISDRPFRRAARRACAPIPAGKSSTLDSPEKSLAAPPTNIEPFRVPDLPVL